MLSDLFATNLLLFVDLVVCLLTFEFDCHYSNISRLTIGLSVRCFLLAVSNDRLLTLLNADLPVCEKLRSSSGKSPICLLVFVFKFLRSTTF